MPIYCEDCECPVCMKCITTSHLQHKIFEASVYVQKRHGDLMASLHGENSLMEKLKNDLICKSKTLEERKIKLVDEISSREEAIVAEVRDIGKHLKKTVYDAVSKWEEKIQKSEKEIENFSEIPDFDTETETNCIKILQCHSELRRLEIEMKLHDPVNVTFETDISLSRKQVEELFGNVVVQHDLCLSSDQDRQIERKPPFHDKNGSKLFSCNKKIKDQENRIVFFQFKPNDETTKKFREILFAGGKMYMHVNDKLFVATDDNSVPEVLQGVDSCVGHSSGRGILCIRNNRLALSLYFHNGKYMSLFSVPNPSNEEILAVEESEKLGLSLLTEQKKYFSYNYPYYKLSIYRVKGNAQTDVISNEKHCNLSTYRNDSQVAKLCALQDTKSQIAIVSRSNSLQVYDQQLSVLFTYKGSIENSISLCSSFSVASACLDQDDNILVANRFDNSIHMLDISGQFLRIVVWPEDGLSNLMSVSVDGEGWLWCVGRNNEGSYLRLFDYDYFKATERTKRALTETEENF
ncbi:uncharacterized protein LOC133178481 [Saccostrea echinata]|uniref:uncharacterized protein LOC133178481 n=1 Tax=Saccostrea echinata TaxID=191078 RepID=UPI002A840766|nr:uncharacterized protein LOC133178481 [Saccostrea echinata]